VTYGEWLAVAFAADRARRVRRARARQRVSLVRELLTFTSIAAVTAGALALGGATGITVRLIMLADHGAAAILRALLS
jgi:hypothetical protein